MWCIMQQILSKEFRLRRTNNNIILMKISQLEIHFRYMSGRGDGPRFLRLCPWKYR